MLGAPLLVNLIVSIVRNKMIALISNIIEVVILLIKSIFKVRKKKHQHETPPQEQAKERPSESPDTRAAGPSPLCEKPKSHHSRKRRKSITETVTRTITVESVGSPSTGSSSPDPNQKTIEI